MFYFCTILLILFHIFSYALFRSGIYDSLRLSKVSKTYIRKHRKGMANYWLYNEIHKEHPLGTGYTINLVFLAVLCMFALLSVGFSYLVFLRIPLASLSTLLCVIELPWFVWIARVDALTDYGRPFVLWAKRRDNRGYYSSLLILFAWIIPVALTVLYAKSW